MAETVEDLIRKHLKRIEETLERMERHLDEFLTRPPANQAALKLLERLELTN